MYSVVKYLFLVVAIIMSGSSLFAQGIITTIAGNGITQYIGDGHPATNFSLGGPTGLCMDKSGRIYISNMYTSRISKLDHDTLSTFAGKGQWGYAGDNGNADTVALGNPSGISCDTNGNFYIADIYFDVVRKINSSHIISTVCGSGSGGFGGDGGQATATLAHMEAPHGTCIDKYGNIYIADYGNHRIRKVIASSGVIVTIAGNGNNGYSGDNGPATTVELSFPSGVCLDAAGNVYFSEHGNHRIRKIDVNTSYISTVAGNGMQGYSGDGGLAMNASLNQPNSVFVDGKGIIYISDFGNNVIRAVTQSGIIATIAGNGDYGYSGDGSYAASATLNGPTAVMVDIDGFIYIADGDNSVIRMISPITFPNAGVSAINGTSFNIYPNPAKNGKIYITIPGLTASTSIGIFNTLGQQVYQAEVTTTQVEINLQGIAAGIYFVQLTSPEGRVVQKVVIE